MGPASAGAQTWEEGHPCQVCSVVPSQNLSFPTHDTTVGTQSSDKRHLIPFLQSWCSVFPDSAGLLLNEGSMWNYLLDTSNSPKNRFPFSNTSDSSVNMQLYQTQQGSFIFGWRQWWGQVSLRQRSVCVFQQPTVWTGALEKGAAGQIELLTCHCFKISGV